MVIAPHNLIIRIRAREVKARPGGVQAIDSWACCVIRQGHGVKLGLGYWVQRAEVSNCLQVNRPTHSVSPVVSKDSSPRRRRQDRPIECCLKRLAKAFVGKEPESLVAQVPETLASFPETRKNYRPTQVEAEEVLMFPGSW